MPPEQLALPIPDIVSLPSRVGLPRAQRVFVNRDLDMSAVAWIGFDLHHVLAAYRRDQLEPLVKSLMVRALLERGYSPDVVRADAAIGFGTRGLMIDKRTGHVLKIDRDRGVRKCFHGLHPRSHDEIRAQYQARRTRLLGKRYQTYDTLASLPELELYASMVEAFVAHGMPLDYEQLFVDVHECAESVRTGEELAKAVLSDLPRLVPREPLLAPTLHKFRSAGKRLMLLTQAPWSFTSPVMAHLLDDAMPEYPTWRHYFDLVVTSALEPSFYRDRAPLNERDMESSRSGALRMLGGERGRAYEGGSLHDLERLLNVSPEHILYVAEHIPVEMLRPRKDPPWRTAMIVPELEAEVAAYEASSADLNELSELLTRRNQLDDELRAAQATYKELSRQLVAAEGASERATLEMSRARTKRDLERIRGLSRQVAAQSLEIESRIDRRFHPYWGSLLKAGTDVSSFGDQVQARACLYTSCVTNFLAYSPMQQFRSPRDLMPHEM